MCVCVLSICLSQKCFLEVKWLKSLSCGLSRSSSCVKCPPCPAVGAAANLSHHIASVMEILAHSTFWLAPKRPQEWLFVDPFLKFVVCWACFWHRNVSSAQLPPAWDGVNMFLDGGF